MDAPRFRFSIAEAHELRKALRPWPGLFKQIAGYVRHYGPVATVSLKLAESERASGLGHSEDLALLIRGAKRLREMIDRLAPQILEGRRALSLEGDYTSPLQRFLAEWSADLGLRESTLKTLRDEHADSRIRQGAPRLNAREALTDAIRDAFNEAGAPVSSYEGTNTPFALTVRLTLRAVKEEPKDLSGVLRRYVQSPRPDTDSRLDKTPG